MQQGKRKSRLLRFLLVLTGLYLLLGILFYFLQEVFLFHPVAVKPEYRYQFNRPYKEWNIKTSQGNISFLSFKPDQQPKGLVLFYHGNMRNVEHYASYPNQFTSRGYEIWMIDYPGFGKTTGERSEERIYTDALLMYDSAAARCGADSIIIYGKSIGTGVAAHVAANRKAAQLILETPYYSIPELAAHYAPVYPVKWMSKFEFPTYKNIQALQVPITMVHGTDDEVIPFEQAMQLKKEKPDARLVKVEGGKHNNLAGFEAYQKLMDSLLR